MKVLIITGGTIHPGFVKSYIQGKHFDRIIVADSGLEKVKESALVPTDIIGDFDSLKNKELLLEYKKRGVPVQTFPVKKDYTDTHLAVLFAARLHPSRITILGATGTRYDHSLANIGLLQWLCDQGTGCVIADEHNEIEMLRGPGEKCYKKDSRLPFFSLLAWGGQARGIDLSGFAYPLENGILTTDISRGISNEITGETARVKLKSGYLLIIRSCD
ncbi:MAG: thiamine diphosphokinase [Eubacterium sp.]|nr:thiamine diphosphokinase [Eubacterium sp.]